MKRHSRRDESDNEGDKETRGFSMMSRWLSCLTFLKGNDVT